VGTFAARVLEVELPHAAQSCTVRIVPGGPHAATLAGITATANGASQRVFWFDLTTAVTPLVLWLYQQTWPEIEVLAGGAPVAAGTTARLLAAPERLVAVRVLAGTELPLAGVARALEPSFAEAATLYLLLPTTVVAVRREAGAPLALDRTAAKELAFARFLLGSCRVHWFWRTDAVRGRPRIRSSTGSR
jgi:hypothetical protein